MIIFGWVPSKENAKKFVIQYKAEILGLAAAFILGALLF